MISPAVAQRARSVAAYHVRLRVVSVDAPAGYAGGQCVVGLSVDRVFRGDDRLVPGQSIRLELFCFVPPDSSPTGPTWLDYSKLHVGALLEAFLNRVGEGFEIPMLQIAFTWRTDAEPETTLWGEDVSRPRWPKRLLSRMRSALRGTRRA